MQKICKIKCSKWDQCAFKGEVFNIFCSIVAIAFSILFIKWVMNGFTDNWYKADIICKMLDVLFLIESACELIKKDLKYLFNNKRILGK